MESGGLYKDIQCGITRGSALSPVIGAYYLTVLDETLSKEGLHYARYMDDIVILARTRWQLRRAIETLNQIFRALRLKQHPDKTFIGRIERGFDFLGYHFSRGPMGLATKTMTICDDNGTGFMSEGRWHPKVPLILVPIGGVGAAEVDYLTIIN